MRRRPSERTRESWFGAPSGGSGTALFGVAGKAIVPLGLLLCAIGLLEWPVVAVTGASVAVAGLVTWWASARALARRAGTTTWRAVLDIWRIPTWSVVTGLADFFDAF